MKKINEVSIIMESRSANEGFARLAAAGFAAQCDPTVEELCDIKTAVSEAVTNSIVHAYKESEGKIYINLVLFSDGVIRIKIRDRGCGIENIEQAMEPMYSSTGGERAGLGFAVMQSFMDSVRVRSHPGKGTTVTLEKLLNGRYHNGR